MTTELRLTLIRLLHRAGHPLSTLEVAKLTGGSRDTTWRLLSRLEESGLISRTRQATATGTETVWAIRVKLPGRR